MEKYVERRSRNKGKRWEYYVIRDLSWCRYLKKVGTSVHNLEQCLGVFIELKGYLNRTVPIDVIHHTIPPVSLDVIKVVEEWEKKVIQESGQVAHFSYQCNSMGVFVKRGSSVNKVMASLDKHWQEYLCIWDEVRGNVLLFTYKDFEYLDDEDDNDI